MDAGFFLSQKSLAIRTQGPKLQVEELIYLEQGFWTVGPAKGQISEFRILAKGQISDGP